MEEKWYFKPWVVILLLFFVLGPFGLPLVYKSPKFNGFWKVGLTVAMIIYTGYLVYATAASVRSVLKIAPELQALLR